MRSMTLHEVIRDAHRNGGGTYHVTGYDAEGYHLDSSRLTEGYYVSNSGGIENLPNAALSASLLSAFIDQRIGSEHFVGLWRDDWNWSLDVTMHYSDLSEALYNGRLYGQKAIWDIAKNKFILLAEQLTF